MSDRPGLHVVVDPVLEYGRALGRNHLTFHQWGRFRLVRTLEERPHARWRRCDADRRSRSSGRREPQNHTLLRRPRVAEAGGRTTSGYRLYAEASLRQLEAIRTAKEAGLSLAEIRELLPVLAGQEARCADVLPVLERKRHLVGDQIRRLVQLQEFLKRSIATCKRAQRTSPTVVCPVLSVHSQPVGKRSKEVS